MRRLAVLVMLLPLAGCIGSGLLAPQSLAPQSATYVGRVHWDRNSDRRIGDSLTIFDPGPGMRAVLRDTMLTTIFDTLSTPYDGYTAVSFHVLYGRDTIYFYGSQVIVQDGGAYYGGSEYRGTGGVMYGTWAVW